MRQGSKPTAHGLDPRKDQIASGWSSGDYCSASAAENPLFHRLVLWLWFLFLFEPARLISFYVPPLSPIKWIPELLLYATMVMWLFSPAPKRHVKWFTVFFGLTLLGTVIAFIFGNWGVARLIVRMMFQYYALGLLTLTFCKTPERASTILRLYFISFLYYAVWGLISLQMEPIVDEINPGIRQIVHWHIHFNNRDGFGPLMVMGLAFSFYFRGAVSSRIMKFMATVSALFCIMGILTSFGRGVFLASIATIVYMLYKAKRKLLGIVTLVAAAAALVFIAPNFTDRYLSIMSTIFSEGTASGTGFDRKMLWGWAWREFLGSPIFGVGTGNFGIALLRVAHLDEIAAVGFTPGRLWGRALHCAPMTVLCEYGLVGALTMARLLVDFSRANRRIRHNAQCIVASGGQAAARGNLFSEPSAIVAISNALSALFIAVLVSSIFYELLYTPLLWHAIIINYLVYLISRDAAREGECRGT